MKILQVNVALIGVELSHRKEEVSEDAERERLRHIYGQISVNFCCRILFRELQKLTLR